MKINANKLMTCKIEDNETYIAIGYFISGKTHLNANY